MSGLPPLPPGFQVDGGHPPLPPGFQVQPAPQAEYVQPAPPPGEIIHGATQSYISDQPEVATTRPTSDPTGRDTAITMEALKLRGENDGVLGAIAQKAIPFTQGTTFGAGDELISTIMAGKKALGGGDFKDNFDYAQEFQRQELAQEREANPIASVVGEVAGGVGSGIGLAKNGVTVVGRMANEGLRNLLPRMLAGAVEGGAYAGASGFAGADGSVENRTDQAVANAPVGAVLGGAAVPAVDVVSALFGRGANILRARNDPAGRADELLVQRMAQDNQTPEQLAQAVEAAQRAGQADYRAVDAAGRNTQRVGAMAAKTPGEARDVIADTFAARQEGQAGRMRGNVNDVLGQGDDAFATEQAIIAQRSAQAEPLYNAAYANPPPQGAFYDDMMTRQSIRDAMPAMERTAAERQIPITDMFAEVPNPNPQMREVPTGLVDAAGNAITRQEPVNPTIRIPTARGWDFVKRELDARVNQLYAANDTTAAEAVKETRNALRGQMSTDVPGYREALANYTDNSAALDAVGTGRSMVTSGNADEATAAFQELNQGQQDLARVGAARELNAKIDKPDYGRDRTRVFNSPDMERRMDTLAADPVQRALFGERVGREQDMVRANRAVTGGSSTAENLSDGAAISDAGGALAALLSGNLPRAIGLAGGQALGSVSRAATGMNEGVANRVGEYLLSADPAQIRQLADLFGEVQTRAYQPRISPAVISAGANAPRSGSNDKRKER